jgi:hypothetical protein
MIWNTMAWFSLASVLFYILWLQLGADEKGGGEV